MYWRYLHSKNRFFVFDFFSIFWKVSWKILTICCLMYFNVENNMEKELFENNKYLKRCFEKTSKKSTLFETSPKLLQLWWKKYRKNACNANHKGELNKKIGNKKEVPVKKLFRIQKTIFCVYFRKNTAKKSGTDKIQWHRFCAIALGSNQLPNFHFSCIFLNDNAGSTMCLGKN